MIEAAWSFVAEWWTLGALILLMLMSLVLSAHPGATPEEWEE